MNTDTITEIPSHLVLFDGVCNLCNGVVQFIIKRDRNSIFSFTSLQSAIGQQVLLTHRLSQIDYDSFIYLREGVLLTKSSAALALFYELGGIWKVTGIFYLIPKFMRDWIYDRVAQSRYSIFGKRDVCVMPEKYLRNAK